MLPSLAALAAAVVFGVLLALCITWARAAPHPHHHHHAAKRRALHHGRALAAYKAPRRKT